MAIKSDITTPPAFADIILICDGCGHYGPSLHLDEAQGRNRWVAPNGVEYADGVDAAEVVRGAAVKAGWISMCVWLQCEEAFAGKRSSLHGGDSSISGAESIIWLCPSCKGKSTLWAALMAYMEHTGIVAKPPARGGYF